MLDVMKCHCYISRTSMAHNTPSMSSVLANHLPSTAYTRQHDDGDIKSRLTMHGTNCISSQSAPSPLRSRWSKRAGLHVVHYALDGEICIVLTRVHVMKFMGGEENGE